jgi:molybdate transport system substrate-binding protein
MFRKVVGAVGAFCLTAALASSALAQGAAQGAAPGVELRLLSPGAVTNAGLKDLAAEFTAKTGIRTTIVGASMGGIVAAAKTGEPATDVVFMPGEQIDQLAKDGAVKAGSKTALGRADIGLAVRKGQPTPDISTPAKLAAVLKTAKGVVYSNPAGGGSLQATLIDNMLKTPQFAGVKGEVSTGGQGAAALARGQGDMALQLTSEIYNYPELAYVGPVPAELGVYIDVVAAVNARTTHPAEAQQFVAFITRPEAAATWKAKGLTPARK